MAYVAPTVRSIGDATTAADYNILANSVIDLNLARVPVAALSAYAGATAPTGWLLCDGSAVSQTTYADLYAIITSTYDVTSPGAGNFRVPDLRGRAVFGKDDMGGTPASRVTSGVSVITGTTLGAVGGTEALHTHTHTQNAHAHGFPYNLAGSNSGWAADAVSYGGSFWAPRFGNGAANGIVNVSGTNNGTATNQNAGTGSSQNMPPTIITNYIIKT